MRGLLLLAGTAAAFAASLTAQTVTTVLSNGTTETRYDMVILGDGYTASEQATFNQDVNQFLTALFQKSPFNIFSSYYNVHTVFRASAQSGADRPDENPPIYVDTVYDATYNYGGVDRCLYIQNTSLALADAALAPANEGRILVMVNDDRYGGCASTFAVSYNGTQMTEVQAHELGHSMGQLADEYEYSGQTYTGPEPAAANITTSPTGQKWSLWHGTQGISAYQGAGYNQYGLWRPRINCLMRALGQVLCRVCQENIVKVTNSIANVITATVPSTTSVTVQRPNVQPFSVAHFVPSGNNPIIEWELDGTVVTGQAGTSYILDSTQVALGTHTVKVTIKDQTDRVRIDPQLVMHETHTWSVTIGDPTLAQLRIPTITSNLVIVNPGATMTLSPTVVNDGPAPAGAFAVEFFLSDNPFSWTLQDTYLGKVDVAGLNSGQQLLLQHTFQLPWSLPLQILYIHAVVDRENVVNEADESDNEISRVILAQGGPCNTGLEFQDSLTTPFEGSMSIAAGGTLHPTVVAPCANPTTTLYLIAWTGSGTTPGTVLGPGLLLPLNVDGLTQIGLDNLNGPIFGSFLGLLDAQGVGQATFALPPSAALPTGTTHFAGVLLGSTTLFTAVSNPIQLTLLP